MHLGHKWEIRKEGVRIRLSSGDFSLEMDLQDASDIAKMIEFNLREE